MADSNSRLIAGQDLTTAGFNDLADAWADDRKVERYSDYRIRDSFLEASGLPLANNEKVLITALDTGTHPSVVGDVGSSGGLTPNSGYFYYNSGQSKLVRIAALDSDIAKDWALVSQNNADTTTADRLTVQTNKELTVAAKDDVLVAKTETLAAQFAAETARDGANAAIVGNQGYFRAARSHVPQGAVIGAGVITTAGSGGTDGVFPLGFVGGNFAVNPTGTFTVSGGAVTAITITGAGRYVGSAISKPTLSFTASAGFTVNPVGTFNVGYLKTAGQTWLTDTDPPSKYLSLFENQANNAVLIEDRYDPMSAGVAQTWAEGTEPGGPGTKSAKGWSEEAALSATRGEQAVSLAESEAPNLFTASELEFTSKVLITGNSDTVAERTNGLGAWKLTSGAGQARSWTRRFVRSLFGTAEKISASILFQKADAASAGTGVGRFLLQQRDASFVEISGTRSTVNFCTQAGLISPSRSRHEDIVLHANCAFVDLYIDLSAVGSNARSVWFREMLVAAGPNSGFRWPIKPERPVVVWVSPTGSDSNAGTAASPLLTLNAAADMLQGRGEIRLTAGNYSITSNGQRLDPSKVIDITLRGERGLTAGTFDTLPIIRLAAKVTGITKTAGRTKIYQATLTSPGSSANFQFAFQDGVADPRTAITTDDRPWLPELRGRTHWLPDFARLLRTTATTLSAALNEIDAAGANDPRAFLDDSTNILYFSIVGGGDGAAANIYYAASAGLTAVTSATRESCGRIRIENIETRYGGIDLTPYRYAALREVRFLGAKTNVIDYSNLHLEGGVEVACAGALIALTGDGVNGKLGAKLTGRGLFAHFNNDDGISPHEGNSCDLENSLFAYNGGTAVAIAYGGDGIVRNARSFRNQQRADPITPANRYKPGAFAVVGSPSEEPNADGGVDTCAVFQNCISIEDYTSFFSDDATGDTAYGTAINCTSIRPVTLGYNITKIVDCDYIPSGTSTAKDARVSVENGVLVT